MGGGEEVRALINYKAGLLECPFIEFGGSTDRTFFPKPCQIRYGAAIKRSLGGRFRRVLWDEVALDKPKETDAGNHSMRGQRIKPFSMSRRHWLAPGALEPWHGEPTIYCVGNTLAEFTTRKKKHGGPYPVAAFMRWYYKYRMLSRACPMPTITRLKKVSPILADRAAPMKRAGCRANARALHEGVSRAGGTDGENLGQYFR
jgi:hypothetical protein